MKISLIIAVCITGIIFLQACSKREPAENAYTRIEGTWRLIATATDENQNGLLDDAEILAVPKGPAELIKFNYDSTGNEHKVTSNGIVEDYFFTWQFENTFHDLSRVISGDTILSHIDLLTNNSFYLRTDDSIFNNSIVIGHWNIYQKK